VIAAGGQAEIVAHGENGYLWDSVEALKGQIRRFLALDDEAVRRMREEARDRARDFSGERFALRSAEIYRSLGVECRVAPSMEHITPS